MKKYQITLGRRSNSLPPITFECTDGISVMQRLKDDCVFFGGKILASDEYAFSAEHNGKNITYTMIELN